MTMNPAQRGVVVVYCLLLVYCCLWVPWQVSQGSDHIRVGYGWLWSGPAHSAAPVELTTPDIPVIQLRFIAATSIAVASFLLAGFRAAPK